MCHSLTVLGQAVLAVVYERHENKARHLGKSLVHSQGIGIVGNFGFG